VQGKAEHPRQLERVPAGAHFRFELVLNEFVSDGKDYEAGEKERLGASAAMPARQFYLNAIGMAMNLLRDDYLGGHGSRGYGQIGFWDTSVVRKEITEVNYGPEQTPSEFIQLFAKELQGVELTTAEYEAIVPKAATV